MVEPDTRTRLLDAAEALVQRVGANAMSFQDLSVAVGIRKPSVHHYFPAKSDLLYALIDRYSDRFLAVVCEIRDGRGNGAARLRRYFQLFEATLSATACESACPCGMLGAEIATLDERPAERLRAFYRDNAALLGEILEAGRADRSLKFDGPGEALAWLLFSWLEGAMLIARADGGVMRFRAQLRQMERLIST